MNDPKKIKKILLLTLEFPPLKGGVSRYYSNLVKFSNLDISVLFWKNLDKFWPKWLPFLLKSIQEIKNRPFNYLFVGQVLPLGYIALFIKIFFKIPYLVFTHGMDILIPQESWWKKIWLKKILFSADWVVANSEFTKKELQKLGLNSEKIIVIYPCVEKSLQQNSTELIQEGGQIILSVGRLVKRKGFDKVIEAMPKILQSFSNVQYVLVGSGIYKKELQKIALNLGLEKKVFFLDNLTDEEVSIWYQRCSVFVMPSRQIGSDVEGFGTVFLEAALYGKPVVAGNSGGVPEAVINKQTGLVIDPNSVKDLEQAIIQILSDKNKAKEMGERGKKFVEDKFQCLEQFTKLEQI